MERQELYRQVDARFDRMMEQGLLEEARQLVERGYQLGRGPLDCPGYREMGQFLNGELTLEEAVNRAKLSTHKLVRRQNTWFKPADARICWLDAPSRRLVPTSRRPGAKLPPTTPGRIYPNGVGTRQAVSPRSQPSRRS